MLGPGLALSILVVLERLVGDVFFGVLVDGTDAGRLPFALLPFDDTRCSSP